MKFNIINSSSKGNCLIVENAIAIDMGIPFSKIKEYLKDLKVVFLTHTHGDHFNKTTIKKIAKERPTLKFVCSSFLAPILIGECFVSKKNIIVLETDKMYDLGMFKCKMYYLFHDAPNVAYMIKYNGYKFFYGTDTGKIDHINCPGCDYYFVEANYESDEELDELIKIAVENNEFTHLDRVKETHLSQVQCMDWLYNNMRENSQYIWMHQHVDGKENNNEEI